MQRGIWKRHLTNVGGAFLILVLLLAPFRSHPHTGAAPPEQDTTARVDALLAAMSTPQKVAQLFMVSLWGQILTLEARDFLTTYQPGGVILFGYNTESAAQITHLTNDIQNTILAQPHTAPAWIAIDQEGGMVARLSQSTDFTTFPVNMAIAATNDPAYALSVGTALAQELRAVGINMNLAPVADVETNPDNPVIFRRAFGSDPQLVGAMVSATIEGLQTSGVMATAKHFPGHGDTSTDSHLQMPVVNLDRERLEAVELLPFRRAIAANAGAIMASHIWFPTLDSTPDTPASLSPVVLTEVLRGELGFNGLIMTDALDMDAIDSRFTLAEASVMAILAGADLITPGPHVSINAQLAAIRTVIAAVEDGTISQERLGASVRRILLAKDRFGVLDWTPLDPDTAANRVNRAEHEQLVAEILSAAVTLVYDNAGAVPFPPQNRVALVYPATLPSIARTCETRHDNLQLVGVSVGPTEEEKSWAVEAANRADAAIVFTYDAHLNRRIQELVRALPQSKTIVVALRSPRDWELFRNIGGYMVTYSPISAAIPAACDALFGVRSITGTLPIDLSEDFPAGTGIQVRAP